MHGHAPLLKLATPLLQFGWIMKSLLWIDWDKPWFVKAETVAWVVKLVEEYKEDSYEYECDVSVILVFVCEKSLHLVKDLPSHVQKRDNSSCDMEYVFDLIPNAYVLNGISLFTWIKVQVMMSLQSLSSVRTMSSLLTRAFFVQSMSTQCRRLLHFIIFFEVAVLLPLRLPTSVMILFEIFKWPSFLLFAADTPLCKVRGWRFDIQWKLKNWVFRRASFLLRTLLLLLLIGTPFLKPCHIEGTASSILLISVAMAIALMRWWVFNTLLLFLLLIANVCALIVTSLRVLLLIFLSIFLFFFIIVNIFRDTCYGRVEVNVDVSLESLKVMMLILYSRLRFVFLHIAMLITSYLSSVSFIFIFVSSAVTIFLI